MRRFAKSRPNLPLDLKHIAEEIQDLGKSERDAVFSLAQRIIEHLLLIEYSPGADQRLHWSDEIDGFRGQMKRKLSPTIRRHLKRGFRAVYADGRRIVERRMRRHGEDRAAAALPASCPYTVEQVLGGALTVGSGARQTQKHQDGPVQPQDVLVVEAADTRPTFDLATVVILSTISRQGARSPLFASGSMSSRNSGASVGSVVKAQSVIEAVASNRSSWRMTAGRGLPTSSLPPATVQTSPRLIGRPGPRWRR